MKLPMPYGRRTPGSVFGGGAARHRRQVISRPSLQCAARCFQHAGGAASESPLPRIAQPSFWQSLTPTFLRRSPASAASPRKAKPTNPATYFIWIYLLIGSQAIRILSLQHEHAAFTRRADHHLAKLREVIEKLQRGEDVDVEKVLGTGDATQEAEWEEALQELDREERAWQKARQVAREERIAREKEEADANPVNEDVQRDEAAQGGATETTTTSTSTTDGHRASAAPSPPASTEIRPPGFY